MVCLVLRAIVCQVIDQRVGGLVGVIADDAKGEEVAGGEGSWCHAVAVENGIHHPCVVGHIEAGNDFASCCVDIDGLTLGECDDVFLRSVGSLTDTAVELVEFVGIESRLGAVGDGKARPIAPFWEVVAVEGETSSFKTGILAEIIQIAVLVDLELFESHHIACHAAERHEGENEYCVKFSHI